MLLNNTFLREKTKKQKPPSDESALAFMSVIINPAVYDVNQKKYFWLFSQNAEYFADIFGYSAKYL